MVEAVGCAGAADGSAGADGAAGGTFQGAGDGERPDEGGQLCHLQRTPGAKTGGEEPGPVPEFRATGAGIKDGKLAYPDQDGGRHERGQHGTSRLSTLKNPAGPRLVVFRGAVQLHALSRL